MKQLIGEYYGDGNQRTARMFVDDVGIVSVECWDGKQLITEKSTFNKNEQSSYEDFADDFVRQII